MLMPLRCPHLTVHRQMLPWQKQPLPRGKAAWRSGEMPSYWENPAKLHGEETLGSCTSPSVFSQRAEPPHSCSRWSSSQALQGQTLHIQKLPSMNQPARRGNLLPPNAHKPNSFLLGENIEGQWGVTLHSHLWREQKGCPSPALRHYSWPCSQIPDQKSRVNSFHSKSKVIWGISPIPETFHSTCLSPSFSIHTTISSLRIRWWAKFLHCKGKQAQKWYRIF